MAADRDLIEDWIQMRSTLVRHVAALKRRRLETAGAEVDATTDITVVQLEKWIRELNTLLKSYSCTNPA